MEPQCPKCKVKLERRVSAKLKKNIRKALANQSYYYQYFYKCLRCKRIFYFDEDKVYPIRSEPVLTGKDCRKCGGELERKVPRKLRHNIKRAIVNQSYYYSFMEKCLGCGTWYTPPEAIEWPDEVSGLRKKELLASREEAIHHKRGLDELDRRFEVAINSDMI